MKDAGFVKIMCGPLAQLAEQLTLNQQVTGSIPVRLTRVSGLEYQFEKLITSQLLCLKSSVPGLYRASLTS